MVRLMLTFLATGLVFLGADFCWLTLASAHLYKPMIGPLLAEKPDLAAAVAFYLIYISGIVYFAVTPAEKSGGWRSASGRGLALGLLAYGTYDLTNQATMRIWPSVLTFADMAWGGSLTAVSACLGFLVWRRLSLSSGVGRH